MEETKKFTWISFYMAFADDLLKFKDDREELIRKLKNVYKKIHEELGLNPPELKNDIDPFTVYAIFNCDSFNKDKNNKKRKRIIHYLKEEFSVGADEPDDFSGLPVTNYNKRCFYDPDNFNKEDIDNLWNVFEAALNLDREDNQDARKSFYDAYNKALSQYNVKWNITMGLFWIRPYKFLNLESSNRRFMRNPRNMDSDVAKEMSIMNDKDKPPSGEDYLQLCDRVSDILSSGDYLYKNFSELSDKAWETAHNERQKKDKKQTEEVAEDVYDVKDWRKLKKYSEMLRESKNIIFHGAPGTGKTYLARSIAAYIISDGGTDKYEGLSDNQKKQIGFVQFHPSYDYTDFVEGLRPTLAEDGSMRFELRNGTFKEFVDTAKEHTDKKYIFIIDEINRGEISKIFGELFFSIDPDYRGPKGGVSTQYANLHDDPNDKFYIPINVYIIGTMNDIDRSVESFDFAMRRRFRFIELKADEQVEMLSDLHNDNREKEAIRRMEALNKEIVGTEGLNENYQIGPAYFLKLKTLNSDQLWEDYLEPLLQEYVRGMGNEKEIMKSFENAYGYQKQEQRNIDETASN